MPLAGRPGASVQPYINPAREVCHYPLSFGTVVSLSEILFLPPSSYFPNFYFFSKPSLIIISSEASLLTPQTTYISLSEFHGTSGTLLDHLPHCITQHNLQVSLLPNVVFEC